MSDDFSALLRRHRDKRRWSQERLATECDMDHSLASRLESGQRQPTRQSVAKLCVGMGLAGPDADALWLAAGLLPPDLCGGAAATTALGVWRALGHAGEDRRRVIEGIIGGALALAGEG